MEEITLSRTNESLSSLLNDGDWACASGDVEGLRAVCRQVARRYVSLAGKASDVAGWAGRDLFIATMCWSDLAQVLRHRRPVPSTVGSSVAGAAE